METEELVRRYAEAQARNDSETMRRLSHADWREDWPQSGERVPNLVEWDGWQTIDTAETTAGEAQGRPRVKLVTWEELHAAATGAGTTA